jgi:hypothetical protein
MRIAIVLVAAAAACGKKSSATIDAPQTPPDAIAPVADAPEGGGIDARVLPDAVEATCTPASGSHLSTVTIATGLTSPVWVTSPAGDARLFVLEQSGRIRIIEHGGLIAKPFLDISADTQGPVNALGNEQGLLGLAFHPDYAHNGRFYVHYTRADDAIVIAEYTVTADPYVADPASARVLLTIAHPGQTNHNSGTVLFGPDGYLYFTVGDGGGGGDVPNNAQNTTRLLGKMMRIDVDTRTGAKPYGIPADNPFASSPDGASDPRPEIWSYGWRNAYRWDFDPANGDQIVADVGQNLVEEIDVIPHGTTPPENFGWHVWEGDGCYTAPCGATGYHTPQVTHTHANNWCAIIGGSVYRGSCFPHLVGKYFYTDNCLAQVWSFTPTGGQAVGDAQVTATKWPGSPTSIHTDALGEMYVTSRDGTVRHIIATP